jgi:hypothetical protein
MSEEHLEKFLPCIVNSGYPVVIVLCQKLILGYVIWKFKRRICTDVGHCIPIRYLHFNEFLVHRICANDRKWILINNLYEAIWLILFVELYEMAPVEKLPFQMMKAWERTSSSFPSMCTIYKQLGNLRVWGRGTEMKNPVSGVCVISDDNCGMYSLQI